MNIPKEPFRKSRYKHEAATVRCDTRLNGTVASSPCLYCSHNHGISVHPKTTRTAITCPLFQAYWAPPHCRANTRQTRQLSKMRDPNGSKRMIFWRTGLPFNSGESVAREAGRKAKIMTRNTAPMGRLTTQISSLPYISDPCVDGIMTHSRSTISMILLK